MFLRIKITKLAAAPRWWNPNQNEHWRSSVWGPEKSVFILMLNTGILVNHVTAVTYRVHLILAGYLMPLNKTFPRKTNFVTPFTLEDRFFSLASSKWKSVVIINWSILRRFSNFLSSSVFILYHFICSNFVITWYVMCKNLHSSCL